MGRNASSGVSDVEAVYASSGFMEHSDELGDDSHMNASGPVGKLSVADAHKRMDGTFID